MNRIREAFVLRASDLIGHSGFVIRAYSTWMWRLPIRASCRRADRQSYFVFNRESALLTLLARGRPISTTLIGGCHVGCDDASGLVEPDVAGAGGDRVRGHGVHLAGDHAADAGAAVGD